MSRVSEIAPKDCATLQQPSHKFNKKLFIYLITLSLTLLSCSLLVCLTLHPSKPEFAITQARIDRLNLTRPSNSSILITIQSHNPNKNTGIFYEEISVFASFKGQQITPLTYIVPFYEEHEATNFLSADLEGKNQQVVSPVLGSQVQNDQRAGNLGLSFEINGKLAWKVGNWKSGVHGFHFNCYIIMPFGVEFPHVFSYSLGRKCSTTI